MDFSTLPSPSYTAFWSRISRDPLAASSLIALCMLKHQAIDAALETPLEELLEACRLHDSMPLVPTAPPQTTSPAADGEGLLAVPGEADEPVMRSRSIRLGVRTTSTARSSSIEAEGEAWARKREADDNARLALVSSMLLVALFYPMDSLPMLNVLRKKWSALRLRRTGPSDAVDELLALLELSPQARLERAVFHLGDVDGHMGPLSLLPQRHRALLVNAPQLSQCAIDMLTVSITVSHVDSQTALKALLDCLSHPLITPGRLMAIIHSVKSVLSQGPCPDRELVRRIASAIGPFFLWPMPHGAIVVDCLTLLERELRAPGAVLRQKFFAEWPQLDVSGVGDETAQIAHLYLAKDKASDSPLLQMLSTTSTPLLPLPDQLAQLKWTVLSLTIRGCLSQKQSALLAHLPREKLNSLYGDVMKIVSQGEAMDSRDAGLFFVQRRLTSICDRALKGIKQTGGAVEPIGQLPPMHLHCISVPLEEETTPVNEEKGEWRFPVTTATRALRDLLPRYQSADGEKSEPPHGWESDGPVWVLDGTRGEACDNVPICKIVVTGGESVLHRVVSAYCELRCTEPALFHEVDVRFYFVPLDQTIDLAQYLMVYDGWYHRHVVEALGAVTKSWPQQAGGETAVEEAESFGLGMFLKEDEQGRTGQQKQIAKHPLAVGQFEGGTVIPPSPAQLARGLIEGYLRSATCPLYAVLYLAECETVGGDIVHLPFLQRFDMGLVPFAHSFAAEKGLLSSRVDVLWTQRQFKYTPAEMTVKFVEMDLSGLGQTTGQLPIRPYWNISLVSVPRIGSMVDDGVAPDPKSKSLEMIVTEVDPKRRKGGPRVMDDSPTKIVHVGMMEMSAAAGTSVSVIVDGAVYGPFVKVKVAATKSGMCMNIMTFNPV